MSAAPAGPRAPADTEAVFQAALENHRAGRLRDAQAGYRRVLQDKPAHAPALHYLGLLAHQAEHHELAVTLIRQATAADPGTALYPYNLAEAYRALGRHEDAQSSYRQAIALDPDWADPHFGLGNALYDSGRRAEAIESYRAAVERAPEDAEAWSNLGNALMDEDRRAEAEAAYRKAIAADPGFLTAHVNLGTALLAAGRIEEAIEAHRAALAKDERFAEAHLNLGNALHAAKREDEALAAFQRAVSLKPDFAEAHNALGLALKERREPSAAAEAFLKAISLRPNDAVAHNNLGIALIDLRRFDDAVAAFETAIRLDPQSPDPHCNRANALARKGRIEDAIASVERALELKPDLAEAHYTMGILLGQRGRFEEALEWQRQAVTLKPGLSEAHYHIAMSKGAKADAGEIERIEALLADGSLSPRQTMNLHFAAGHAADDAGLHDQAWGHFVAANSLKRAEAPFDRDNLEPYLDAIRATFDAAYFDARAGAGDPSEVPVFVLGMPRSGTTLVEQIIASHPEAHGAGELEELGQLIGRMPQLLATTSAYPEVARRVDASNARALAKHYLDPLRARAPDAKRVTDKMPGNFLRIGLIAVLFPKARIVHVRRDPLDTCLSCYVQHFARGQHFSYDLEDLGHYWRQYERLMAHWRQVLPGRMFEVQYEDLVARQEVLSREIVAHCGLAWDARCLAFHEHERQVSTASFWQVRQPLYASSIGRWRNYERHLEPLKRALGLA